MSSLDIEGGGRLLCIEASKGGVLLGISVPGFGADGGTIPLSSCLLGKGGASPAAVGGSGTDIVGTWLCGDPNN